MSGKRHTSDPLSVEVVELIAGRFRILGEPIRIRLLQALQPGARNVSDLVDAVGSTQPNISRHLRILQDAGLVSRRQDGNSVFYSITDPTVFALCDVVCSSIRTRLTRHATLADELRRRAGQR